MNTQIIGHTTTRFLIVERINPVTDELERTKFCDAPPFGVADGGWLLVGEDFSPIAVYAPGQWTRAYIEGVKA